ncbi:hypothetical protein Btru_039314 [Bulinus truncatus]|nr:hypothetical protein Btru_039314 [Bulinus truncatus]
MGLYEVTLPPDLPNWYLIKNLLQELHTRLCNQNISDQETGWFMQTIYVTIQSNQPVSATCSNPISRLVQSVFSIKSPASPLSRLKSQIQSNVKKKLDPDCIWYGIIKYLKSVSKSDKEHFLYTVLPGIIDLALAIEKNRPPNGLNFSKKQNNGSTVLSRQFVCSVVACFFLCLFPERKRETKSNLNIVNFTTFFQHLQLPSQVSKLRCILHYFECIIEREMKVQGNIIVTRKTMKPEWMLEFDQLVECEVNLCPVNVYFEGSIEDSAPHAIQVDFANQSVGGCALGRGRVQEEIKFCVCPELLSLLLFMESVDPNEAISVAGFEQFSCYRGYADSLQFAGHYSGQLSNKMPLMVAIDALSYRELPPFKQYEESFVMRDLNKALVGFCRQSEEHDYILPDMESKSVNMNVTLSSFCDVDQHISCDEQAAAQENVAMPADSRQTTPSLPQSPDSIDSVDTSPDMPTFKQSNSAAFSTADLYRSKTQPPAFISGIIHGNDSRLHVSPLSLLSSVPHIFNQPVLSDPIVNTSCVLQPLSLVHSSDPVTTRDVAFPGIEPSYAHELNDTHGASQVQLSHLCSSEPAGSGTTAVTERSRISLLTPEQQTHPLLNLEQPSEPSPTAVRVFPTRSSAFGTTPFSSSDSSSVHCKEKTFPAFEDIATEIMTVNKTGLPLETKEIFHKWPFDILGNLPKVFTSNLSHSGLSSRGLSSSVDTAVLAGSRENLEAVHLVQNTDFKTHYPEKSSGLIDINCERLNYVTQSSLSSNVDPSPTVRDSMKTEGNGFELQVNLDHKSLITCSAGDEKIISPLTCDILSVSMDENSSQFDNSSLNYYTSTVSFNSNLLEPTSSISPQSSISSANISPQSSFTLPGATYQEPQSGCHEMQVSADFFIPSLGDLREPCHTDSKDLQAKLRDFLSSSSSGSRSSGSGPYSSCNSTWGSRSGSISSHGTNGSSNDFIEFWSHLRRRSSQLSDNTSRRSSSSKHSSDFSTDLEEISENLQKHNHGIIEEEGGLVTLMTDYATQFVSTAVQSAVVSGANLSAQSHGDVEVDTQDMPQEMGRSAHTQDMPQEMGRSAHIQDMPQEMGRSAHTQDMPQEMGRSAHTQDMPQEMGRSAHTQDMPQEMGRSAHTQDMPQEMGRSAHTQDMPHEIGRSAHTLDMPQEMGRSAHTQDMPQEMGRSAPPKHGRVRRAVSRAGTLVRQDKVNLELDEGHCFLESGIAEKSSSLSKQQDDVCDVVSSSNEDKSDLQHMFTPPKPVFYTSFIPVQSSTPSPFQSLDSGFVSIQPDTSSSNDCRLALYDNIQTSEPPTECISRQPVELNPSGVGVPFEILPQQHEKPSLQSVETVGSKLIEQESTAAASGILVSTTPTTTEPTCCLSTDFSHKMSEDKNIVLKKNQSESQKASDSVAKRLPKEKSSKPKSSRIPEKSSKISSIKHSKDTKNSVSREAAAASVSPSSTDSMSHLSSGASGPSETGIPKLKSSSKKFTHTTKSSQSIQNKSTDKHETASMEKARMLRSKKASTKDKEEVQLKAHKSRYVISDVAAPPREKRLKHRDSPHKKYFRSSSQRLEDKKKSKSKLEEKNIQDYTKSPRFIRFVNSMAEMSVSQAVLEGAELLSQSNLCKDEISDEVYNWFANKIINEVFTHVISEIESREFLLSKNSSHLKEIGASGEVMTHFEVAPGNTETCPLYILGASAREPVSTEAGTARPKSKSILPSRSDTAASGAGNVSGSTLQRSSGSLKMVTFKEGIEDPKLSQSTGLFSSHQKSVNTFPRPMSGGLPIPLRRRSSLDLPLLSPSSIKAGVDVTALQPILPQNGSTSHAPERVSLTNADLSVNIYQAAASIVNQVFQNISDSMDVQALSPGSSCLHGTLSSSDTGVHSTGSRIHSHYDSFTSNIFSSSSTKASESPRRARRSVSPSIGVFFRKPMSRETLTSAYLKVDHSPQIKSYERRSSEPCQTSVQLSLQAFNNNKFNGRTLEDKKKIARTDDDIGRGNTWRRGSLEGFSFDQRRNSCGFKDPILSRFAEELMKADTSVPELVIVGSHASSSSTGSRRSSGSAYRDSSFANLETELLNASFTSACSMSSRSQKRHSQLDRSRSRDSRQGKSDSSDTEYWFPPPKFVGDEFQQEYNRQHSQDELQDYASFFAGQVVQEAVCVLRCDPDYLSQEQKDVDMYAENLTDQIMRDALISSLHVGEQNIRLMSGQSRAKVAASSDIKKNGNERSRIPSYSGQGAIPKVKVAKSSPRVASQPRNIPQRKTEQSVEQQIHSRQSEFSSNSRVKFSKPGQRRALGAAGAGISISPSQQYLHPTFKPASSPPWPGGARPKQQTSSAADRHLPSRSKRHSSPSPLSFSSSIPVPHQSSSPSSLQVPRDISHRRHLNMAMRSKSESYTSGSSYLVSRPPVLSQADKSSYKKRDESPASYSSIDNGSCPSDQTCSSQLYSSVSSSSSIDSIGPTSHDRSLDYHLPPSVFHEIVVAQTQTDEGGQHRFSLADHFSQSNIQRVPGYDMWDIIQFSDQISQGILSEVMQHCKQDTWLKYLSYHQPIATGNWGCGAYHGNPQLKFILQWIAASIARSPRVMYYTFGDSTMTQAQDIANMVSNLTVGQLAGLLREYCSLACLQSPASFSSPGRQWSPWQHSQSTQPSISLFDFLKQKFDPPRHSR